MASADCCRPRFTAGTSVSSPSVSPRSASDAIDVTDADAVFTIIVVSNPLSFGIFGVSGNSFFNFASVSFYVPLFFCINIVVGHQVSWHAVLSYISSYGYAFSFGVFSVIRDMDLSYINDCKGVSGHAGVYEVWIHAVYFYFSPMSFCSNNCGALYLIMVGKSFSDSRFYDDASKVTNQLFFLIRTAISLFL